MCTDHFSNINQYNSERLTNILVDVTEMIGAHILNISKQDYIDSETLAIYDAIDVNVYQSNIFHTKMLRKEVELQHYLFNTDVYELPPKQRLEITSNLRKEMIEIFSGMNIY